jgi:hypothetical protein
MLDLLFGGVKNVLLRVGLALLEHLQGKFMGYTPYVYIYLSTYPTLCVCECVFIPLFV